MPNDLLAIDFPPVPGYPASPDVYNYLRALGFSTDKLESLMPRFVTAGPAAALWEQQSLWRPFLSTGQTEDRYFDPPEDTRYLDLGAGLISCTSLSTGAVQDGPTGTALTPGQGYRLLPLNAPASGRPYEVVEFLSGGYGGSGGTGYAFSAFGGGGYGGYGAAGSVKVSGVWGRCLALPEDVRQAILDKAAAAALTAMNLALSGGLSEITNADGSRVKFAGVVSGLFQGSASFDALSAQYRRTPLYIG